MLVIGLTGPTGSGKSSVCRILADWEKIRVIDCDQLARRVVEKGKCCLLDLAVEFSSAIINPDGTLNRRRLAALVFTDSAKLERLNEIVFPYILEEIREELNKARREKASAAVLDAPTLFESGADALCDTVVAVVSSPSLRQFRIMERDHLTPEEAQHRMESQQDEEFYTDRADHVLRNDEDTTALRLEVLELMNQLGL